MKREHIITAVLSFCTTLRLSQSKTLSELVCAATKLSHASLAQLGRTLAQGHPVAVKHCVKRVDRLVGIGLQRVQVPPDNWSLQSVAIGAGKGGNELR